MTKQTLTEIKNLIIAADDLHAASADEAISEQAQDKAYIDYHATVAEMAAKIKNLLNIDDLTAKRMAHFKRREIGALIARMR
jgi:hypothetical protein